MHGSGETEFSTDLRERDRDRERETERERDCDFVCVRVGGFYKIRERERQTDRQTDRFRMCTSCFFFFFFFFFLYKIRDFIYIQVKRVRTLSRFFPPSFFFFFFFVYKRVYVFLLQGCDEVEDPDADRTTVCNLSELRARFRTNKTGLTHWRLETPKRVTGKQCRPRSDSTERGDWSGSPLFANSSTIFLQETPCSQTSGYTV